MGNGFTMERGALHSLVEGSRSQHGILSAIEAGYIRAGLAPDADPSIRENNRLIAAIAHEAKANGAFIDNIEDVAENTIIGQGAESFVYLSKSGTHTVKLNNTHMSGNFTEFLARIAAHNARFPDDPYRIIGMAEDPEAATTVVLQQPFVKSIEIQTSQNSIDAALQEAGYVLVPGSRSETDTGTWVSADGNVEIRDARPANVLTDTDGRLHFIDTLITDKTFAGKTPKELFRLINLEAFPPG